MAARLKLSPVVSLYLKGLPSGQKIAITVLFDLAVLIPCVFFAYALRVSAFEFPPQTAIPRYLIAPLLSITLAAVLDVYSNSVRNFSLGHETRIIISQILTAPLWSLLLLFLGVEEFARSVVIIYVGLSILGMIGVRRLASLILQTEQALKSKRTRTPILIYGAAEAGVALAAALERQGQYQLRAFVDSDYTLVGRKVMGRQVFDFSKLSQVVERYSPEDIFIAKSNLSRANRRILVDASLACGLAVKTIPGVEDILSGSINLDAIRPINVTDLLGREPVPPDRKLMEEVIKNRTLLISGAGGSIGSELVRQIIAFKPAKIIMLDNSEFALFKIHREMEQYVGRTNEGIQLVAVLADACDKQRIEKVMMQHGVEVIFHAAAYKHVRMVQENAEEGIRNNVNSTRAMAEAAINAKVKLFVLISTDKAVRPTSIMGASKRVAEMIIQALADKKGEKPIFAMVRFGNVLGSTGSVVPLFKEQIEAGGPVHVTDREVTRYFMLIPEAAQLVIQAAGMAKGGEVFVLDMGEPIKIAQLAKTMIEIAGLTLRDENNPSGDIEIKYVGLREGEKLFEELQIGHDVSATRHPRIMKSREVFLPYEKLSKLLYGTQRIGKPKISQLTPEVIMKLANMKDDGDLV